MSLNGSGSYSPPAADFPAVANTLIESTKFNNIINDIATALSTAVYKDGQQTVTANIPMGGFRLTGLGAGAANGQSLRYEQLFTTSAVTLLGALDMVKGADIASAGTLNLTTATGNGVHVTGTTTITAVTLGSGMWRLVVFDGALTLTHHATNNNLPGGANITTAAGDRALYWADGTTVYCAVYMKANGKPIAGASGAITSSDFTMTTARLLGRTTASTGAIEEVSVDSSLSLAATTLSIASSGVTTAKIADANVTGAKLSLGQLTNSLSGDVALNNTGSYFAGPSVAQGTTGTWFFSGTVTMEDTGAAAIFDVRLTDGTTIIASGSALASAANNPVTVSLSGYLTNPAGNVSFQVKDRTNTTGQLRFNESGNSKDCTLSAFRIG